MADGDIDEFDEGGAQVNHNLERGQNMEGDCILERTKKIYASELRQVTTFFQNHSRLDSIVSADNEIINFALYR